MGKTEQDYTHTLNLPRTSFPMRAKLAAREPDILDRWATLDIYEQIQSRPSVHKSFLLHDGPPYANGNIHLGQAFNKLLKDFILKFKGMQGFRVPFVPGWDCHGLPVEYQLLKTLQLSKSQVDILEFRRKAREYAMQFVVTQRRQFQRLGIFGRWQQPYLTMDRSYESDIIRAFGSLAEQGYIQRRLKPIHWCWSCETALAEAEIEYKQKQSPSVFVLFDLDPQRLPVDYTNPVSMLIWTTTPWTLPANRAIAVHPDLEYVLLESDQTSSAILLAAPSLNTQAIQKLLGQYRIIATVPGARLKGLMYRRPFEQTTGTIINATFIDPQEGTGCVHIAPGHGEEDYFLGIRENLEVFSPVDNSGCFTDEVDLFKSMQVFHANDLIQDHLKQDQRLLCADTIEHSYPHCWRCGNPVIFRATPQWFLTVDHENLRERAIDIATRTVSWIPAFSQTRIRSMLKERPDWCLSRQRFWGVGIPVLYCANCKKPILNNDVIELVAASVRKHGSDAWFENPADNFVPPGFSCPSCSCPTFTKETDILDVWFESGVSHEAVLAREPELSDPADLYLEGSDQHRGWFQTSLLTSIGTKGRAPYRKVLTHGFVVDGHGKKMSKSVGNVVDPQQIINKYGAEILRLWSALEDYSEDIRISDQILQYTVEVYRRIRNSFRYLLGNLSDFHPATTQQDSSQLREVDRFVLSRLQRLIIEITASYEKFRFHEVVQRLHKFANNNLSAFYFDILKDRLYTLPQTSIARRSAQTVLWELLITIVKLSSPILAFTAEETWQHIAEKIGTSHDSVFLSPWPVSNPQSIDTALENKWSTILDCRQTVLGTLEQARRDEAISSSLDARLVIKAPNPIYAILASLTIEELTEIFIVSQLQLEYADQLSIEVTHASGTKCERCWNYSVSVGTNAAHPTLCHRCWTTVDNMENHD